MIEPIETVVVGFGLAGRVFHAPFVSAVPGLRLNGIVQRRGNEAADAWPEARQLRTVEEALADPAVRLIVVATPNDTHFGLARQALESGKHVVIDKPFAATSAQALELVELARAQGVVLAPFHNRRWDGDFLTVKKLLADQAVGRLVTFESHFDRFRPLPREGTWKEADNAANGLLMDLGPHLVDQALALFGVPQTIAASVRRDRDTTGIEDAFDIALGYPRLQVYCRATMLAAENSPHFLLHGTRGSFRKFGVDPQEPALVAGAKVPFLSSGDDGSGDDWLAEDKAAWGTLTIAPDPAIPGTLERTLIETERGDYRGFYAGVRDAIRGIAPLAAPAEDGYRVIRLLEMARESSRLERTLEVDL